MKIIKSLLASVVLGAFAASGAMALTIVGPFPIDDLGTGVPPPNCSGVGTGNDSTWISNNCTAMLGLPQLYKDNVGGSESGLLAGSYESLFNVDASGGTITWVADTDAVTCSADFNCWLLIKDGNQDPGRYAYNLTTLWNGTDTITLSGFWPENGAISHWALYSGAKTPPCDDPDGCEPDRVPEPASLALVGLALAGAAIASRRRRRG